MHGSKLYNDNDSDNDNNNIFLFTINPFILGQNMSVVCALVTNHSILFANLYNVSSRSEICGDETFLSSLQINTSSAIMFSCLFFCSILLTLSLPHPITCVKPF